MSEDFDSENMDVVIEYLVKGIFGGVLAKLICPEDPRSAEVLIPAPSTGQVKECVVLGEVLVKPVLLVPAKLRETNLLRERIKEVFLIVSSKVLL